MTSLARTRSESFSLGPFFMSKCESEKAKKVNVAITYVNKPSVISIITQNKV